jgi:ATP-dependent protease ClpP protease subunit
MKPWFTITNKDAGQTEILLYGEIGRGWDGGGNDPKDFIRELDGIPVDKDIVLHIHSPGGSVYDGLAIYNRLLERKEHLRAVIDGVALSAASWIAMAAKSVEMPESARMMVHDAQGLVIGDSTAMTEAALWLDRESDNIAGIYAEKTGKPRDEMRELMRKTTWMTGAEAKAAGFADVVTRGPAAENTFDLSRFRNSGAEKGGSPALAVNNSSTPPMENAITPAPAGPVQPDLTNQATLAEARAVRAEAEATTLKLGNIARTRPGINVEAWTPRVIKDPSLLENLITFPESGSDPLHTPIVNRGNPAIETWDKLTPGAARRRWMVNQENWTGLIKAKREMEPTNVNTLTLTMPRVLEDSVITILQNKLAMLNAFSTAFSPDPGAPRRTVIVPYVTAGAATVTDGTNFETGDATVAEIAVTIHHYSKPFHMDNNALNQGWKIAMLADINATGMANALSDVVTALMLAANYGAATAIGAAAAFDAADLPAVLALAANYTRKNLILASGHYAYLAPLDRTNFNLGEAGAYGFDLLAENNRWTSAIANICGFVCSPTAMAVASGLPYPLPVQFYQAQGTVTVPNGLSVATCSWFSTSTRLQWASYDICFGANVGDTTAAELLVTA